MTRRKWTTDEQGEWLNKQLDKFTASMAKKTTSTEFFPQVLKEWHQKWPVPNTTPEEIAAAKNADDAMKKKRNKDDSVR